MHYNGNPKHGYKKRGEQPITEYNSWRGARNRCNNIRHIHYKYYGGRGIKVCEGWDSFAQFLADMGRKPTPQHTLDRIDNNGDYTPDNCRWATKHEQSANSRATKIVTIDGITAPMSHHAKRYNISTGQVSARVNRLGWTIEEAIIIPPARRGTNNTRHLFYSSRNA